MLAFICLVSGRTSIIKLNTSVRNIFLTFWLAQILTFINIYCLCADTLLQMCKTMSLTSQLPFPWLEEYGPTQISLSDQYFLPWIIFFNMMRGCSHITCSTLALLLQPVKLQDSNDVKWSEGSSVLANLSTSCIRIFYLLAKNSHIFYQRRDPHNIPFLRNRYTCRCMEYIQFLQSDVCRIG